MNQKVGTGPEQHPHVPVMAAEVMRCMAVHPAGTYVDCTAGYGGHAELIADQLQKGGRLIAVDHDATAVEYTKKRLKRFGDLVTVIRANFSDLADVLSETGAPGIDGILFDLGTSVPQLRDETGRGFSFTVPAPLDMRMDDRQTMTAADVVNEWRETELARIFYEYSDERYSRAIARAIVKRRKKRPFRTTDELASVITGIVSRRRPAGGRRRKLHPATRVFQAVRMAVNDEVNNLDRGLDAAADALAPGGRLCAISFHSIEHRRIKAFLRERARECSCPPGLPKCVCKARKEMRIPVRRAIKPSAAEIAENPQSRSAQLRFGEKTVEATR